MVQASCKQVVTRPVYCKNHGTQALPSTPLSALGSASGFASASPPTQQDVPTERFGQCCSAFGFAIGLAICSGFSIMMFS